MGAILFFIVIGIITTIGTTYFANSDTLKGDGTRLATGALSIFCMILISVFLVVAVNSIDLLKEENRKLQEKVSTAPAIYEPAEIKITQDTLYKKVK